MRGAINLSLAKNAEDNFERIRNQDDKEVQKDKARTSEVKKFNKNWLRFDAKDLKAGDEGLRYLSHLMQSQKPVVSFFQEKDADEDDSFISLGAMNDDIQNYKEMLYT